MSDDLTDFLLERISEDEQRARYGDPYDDPSNHEDDYTRDWHETHSEAWHTARCGYRVGEGLSPLCVCGVPARVLSECAAKRRIVDVHQDYGCTAVGEPGHETCGQREWCYTCGQGASWPCETLLALAAPYSDHPAFRTEWSVE